MSDRTPQRAYRPIDAGSGGGVHVPLRAVTFVLFLASAAVLFAPWTLRYVFPGWHGGASADMVVRGVAFAVLVLTMAVSGVADQARVQGKQLECWRAFALEVGGEVSNASLRPTAGGGWEGGPRVAYTAEGRPVVLTCYGPRSSDRFTRLGATLPLARDVQFQILANTAANRVLMSSAIWSPVLKLASREAAKGPEGAERAQALERMRFLGSEPLVTGDPLFDRAFLLKATDERAARDVAADPAVRSALEQLAGRDRYFRLSLSAAAAPGPAQLEIELAGRQGDIERLRVMHALLLAVMARLDRAGLLGTDARHAS
jgi:hypothetical protein